MGLLRGLSLYFAGLFRLPERDLRLLYPGWVLVGRFLVGQVLENLQGKLQSDGDATRWGAIMTQGIYGGGTFGWPWGGEGGLYVDNHGRIYPQLYGGSPGGSLSAGYTADLEGLLTGTSVSGSPGRGPIRFNAGTSGGATGVGIGTPGIGVTHGFGPLEMSHDFSRPWATPYIRDSAATRGAPADITFGRMTIRI
jgi:hypothetical protein